MIVLSLFKMFLKNFLYKCAFVLPYIVLYFIEEICLNRKFSLSQYIKDIHNLTLYELGLVYLFHILTIIFTKKGKPKLIAKTAL